MAGLGKVSSYHHALIRYVPPGGGARREDHSSVQKLAEFAAAKCALRGLRGEEGDKNDCKTNSRKF